MPIILLDVVAMLLAMLVAAGFGTSTLEDGPEFILDLVRGLWANFMIALKSGVATVRRTARCLLYLAATLFVLYVASVVTFIISMIWKNSTWVFISCMALSAFGFVIFTFSHNLLNAVNRLVYPKYSSVHKRPQLSTLVTLTLLPLATGIMVLTFAVPFFGWLGLVYGVFVLAGVAGNLYGTYMKTERAMAPIILTITCFAFAFAFAFLNLFPQQVRAANVWWAGVNVSSGRNSLAKEVLNRPENTVTAEKAYLYKVTVESGNVIKKERYMDTGVLQYLKAGDKFKTISPAADTVDIGMPVVQIFRPDPVTGEYVLLDQKGQEIKVEDLPWIGVENTDIAQNQMGTPGPTPTPDPNAKPAKTGPQSPEQVYGFEVRKAYKPDDSNKVYVYGSDQKLHWITSEEGYARYYGATYNRTVPIQNYAPVYRMPHGVPNSMFGDPIN